MGAKIALQAIRQHVDGDSQHLEKLRRDVVNFQERNKFEDAVRPIVSKVYSSDAAPNLLEMPGLEAVNFVGMPGHTGVFGALTALQTAMAAASQRASMASRHNMHLLAGENLPQSVTLLETVGLQPNIWTIPDMLH